MTKYIIFDDFFHDNQEIFMDKIIKNDYIGEIEYNHLKKDLINYFVYRNFRYIIFLNKKNINTF